MKPTTTHHLLPALGSPNRSLAMKLNIGILLVALPTFIVSLGILFLKSRNNIKTGATERATSVLNTTTERVVSYLTTVETATNANTAFITANMHPDSLLAYSRRIVLLNGNVDGCSITTEPDIFPQYGRYFSAYTVRQTDTIITAKEAEYEYFDKTWYKSPAALGKACWTDPYDDYTEGTLSANEAIASYCKPLYDRKNRFVGVIATDLRLSKLAKIINTEKPYPHAYFMMLGQDGHYFVHPDSSLIANQTIFCVADDNNQADLTLLARKMVDGETGAMRVFVNGSPSLVCFQRVEGTRWSIALVCPDSDILQSYYQLTYLIIPLTIIGLLLILLLCRHIVANAISPLNRLVDLSQHIATGHYDQQIPTTRRRDVVGRLQNSFAAMQQSLDQHISSIKQANIDAEHHNKELQKAQLMAEEANRQKTAFIQNMTHQIRTPLNIIMGFSQVLRDSHNLLPPEEVSAISEMMNHNASLLNRMVLMLYDCSETGLAEELQSHRQETVPCNEVIRESISYTHQNFPGLSIHFETTLPDAFAIHSNRLYMMRSVRELLYNAAKYSDGQHIAVKASVEGDSVHIVFEDTGPGIAEEYHNLMFEPFTKVNDLSEGLGLGLPLTKRHILNLGGDLILDHDYHAGCRFTLVLPIQ